MTRTALKCRAQFTTSVRDFRGFSWPGLGRLTVILCLRTAEDWDRASSSPCCWTPSAQVSCATPFRLLWLLGPRHHTHFCRASGCALTQAHRQWEQTRSRLARLARLVGTCTVEAMPGVMPLQTKALFPFRSSSQSICTSLNTGVY